MRFNAYTTYRMQSAKGTVSIDEFLPFPWEINEKQQQDTTAITKNEIERLQAKAEAYIKSKQKE